MVDFSLVYRYAVVLQDPKHDATEQPRFDVRAYDSLTLGPLPCFQFSYVADSGLPGFYNAPYPDTAVRCRNWSTGTINLGGWGGRTVIIDFATGDCSLGQHFGYAYVDMSYGLFAIKTVSCDADSITLNGPPGFNVYSWYDSTTGVLVDTARNFKIPKPAASKIFMLVLMPYPGYGCPDTLYTTVLPEPKLFHACPDTVVCPGGNARLYIIPEDTGTITYEWSPGGVGCPTCPTTSATPAVTTQYIVTGTNSIGCSKKDTVNVLVTMGITQPASDTFICQGGAASLSIAATSAFLPLSYAWSPPGGLSCTNCAAPAASPGTTTTYSVQVTDAMGCKLNDQLTVSVDDMKVDPKNEIICDAVGVTLSTGTTSASPPFTYSWLPAEQISCDDCPSPYATPTLTTTYTFTVTNAKGCSTQGSIKVIVDTLLLHAMPDTTICNGFPVILIAAAKSKAGVDVSYTWAPSFGLNCANCPATEVHPPATTVYTIMATAGACTVYDSVTITIDTCDIYIPNSFTPNADGLNDIFRVVGHLDYFHDFSFSIYNRWGQRVFYTEDISSGWDGRYKGIDAELGTYFYMVLYSLYDRKHMMKGDFHLIR
jgi:gliding motility-associated-like protein